MIDKGEGSQILRTVQGITHNVSDEGVEAMLDELQAYLDARKKPETEEREATAGHDRQERSGITRRRR